MTPLFLEHLAFWLGNTLYFIRITGADGHLQVPGDPRGLLSVADGCQGHACRIPMRRRGGEWVAASPGLGLVDARTGRPVDPPALVSDEKIEMKPWELQSFVVQVVRDQLADSGRQLMSWSDNPDVSPFLWFVGDSGHRMGGCGRSGLLRRRSPASRQLRQ